MLSGRLKQIGSSFYCYMLRHRWPLETLPANEPALSRRGPQDDAKMARATTLSFHLAEGSHTCRMQ
jgi:hypothetical protein